MEHFVARLGCDDVENATLSVDLGWDGKQIEIAWDLGPLNPIILSGSVELAGQNERRRDSPQGRKTCYWPPFRWKWAPPPRRGAAPEEGGGSDGNVASAWTAALPPDLPTNLKCCRREEGTNRMIAAIF